MLEHLRSRSALVLDILQYDHRLQGSVEQFKAVAQLIDGSRLHINEVWVRGELRKYAYYWLTPAGDVIRGWDNAPHHPQIETSPHHVHDSDGVRPSEVRSLSDVLNMLSERLVD